MGAPLLSPKVSTFSMSLMVSMGGIFIGIMDILQADQPSITVRMISSYYMLNSSFYDSHQMYCPV
ncbi:hypothetical protein ABKV19_010212 [Rosa sericea]